MKGEVKLTPLKQKRAITAEDLLKVTSHSDPQFSSDGKSFAFVSTYINEEKNYESQLYCQTLNNREIRQWTFDESSNSHPRFSPDNSMLAFQSNRSGLQQLWLLHTAGGEAKQITFFNNGASHPHWSKDGKSIIFSAALKPDDDVTQQEEQTKEERQKEQEIKNKQPIIIDRLKHKSDAGGFLDQTKQQLIIYDIETEHFRQLTTADVDHEFQDISPCGNFLLFSTNLSEHSDREQTNDLYTLNLITNHIVKITQNKGTYGNARFSPCGKTIACLGHDYKYSGATLTELYLIDVKTHSCKRLTKNWDVQLGDAMISDSRLGQTTIGPVWSKDGKYLYFIATDFGATGVYQANLTGEINTIYSDHNHVFGFTYHDESDSFILAISSPLNPGDFYLLNQKSGLQQLTHSNQTLLNEVELIEPEELIVQAEDGWNIQGWLMRPFNMQEGKTYPFILEIHGGPHAMYGQSFFHEMQLLAAKGYAVLYTNPRGSHGYGQRFVDAVRGDYGGKDYRDLMSAVDYVLKHFDFIDHKRLGVTGGSYGGFMTNWIVGHTDRFKAAVTQRSISNWLSFYGVSDIGYFFTKWELGENLLDHPEKLWQFSPLKYAKNITTPLLILHGEQDLRCPIEQGEQLFTTLKHLEKEVEFIRFPEANHELSRSGNPSMRIERLNHICRWFKTYL